MLTFPPVIRRRTLLHLPLALLPLRTWAVAGAPHPPRGAWRPGTSLPFAVQEIYPAVLDGRIHVAGGFAVPQAKPAPTGRHVAYDPALDAWQALADLPAARHHPGLAVGAGRLYALGGYAAGERGDWLMQAQSWVYDANADAWQQAPEAPEAHGESVALGFDNAIHVIGGRTPRRDNASAWQHYTDSDRHLVFDARAATWQRLAPAPTARYSAAGALIEGRLYVTGGRTMTGGNVAALDVYEPGEDRWRAAAPMPQAQGGLAAATLGGRLIALGGEFFGREGAGVYDEVWAYDPQRDHWDALPPMPTARHGLGAVSIDDSLYAIGGATSAGARGTSAAVEVFEFEAVAT